MPIAYVRPCVLWSVVEPEAQISLFRAMGWQVRNTSYYESISNLQIIRNEVKHRQDRRYICLEPARLQLDLVHRFRLLR